MPKPLGLDRRGVEPSPGVADPGLCCCAELLPLPRNLPAAGCCMDCVLVGAKDMSLCGCCGCEEPAAGAAWEPDACSEEKPRDRLRVRSASKTANAASTAVLERGGCSCWGAAAAGPAGAAAAGAAGLLLLEEWRDRWPALSPQSDDTLSWAGSWPPSPALPLLLTTISAAASEKGLLVLLPLLLLVTAALALFLSDCREGGRPCLCCPGLLSWDPPEEPAPAAAAVELEEVLLMLDLDFMLPRVCL